MTTEQTNALRDLPGSKVEGELERGQILVRITGRLFRLTRGGYFYPFR